MAEKTAQIDTSALDKYIELVRQQRILEDYRSRAGQMKGKVDGTVHQRVVDDYTARHQALVAAIDPLRTEVRAEFERLRAYRDRLDRLREQALLEKRELEFRRQVGEIGLPEATERLAAPLQAIADIRTRQTNLEKYYARFVEAFGSEEALLGAVTIRMDGDTPRGSDAPSTGTRAVLHVEGDGPGTIDYALGAVARIGRADDNEICIQSRGLSRQHAVIMATASGFALRDLESQNGTMVNGERIVERELADGDVIMVGDAKLRFSVLRRPAH